MFKSVFLLGVVAIGFSSPSLASSAREMGQSELRQIAKSGGTISMKDTLSSVSDSLHATVVEARAFNADGVYYRLVLKRSNGKLISVIINAQNGRQVSPKSFKGRQVVAAASAKARTKTSSVKPLLGRSNGQSGGVNSSNATSTASRNSVNVGGSASVGVGVSVDVGAGLGSVSQAVGNTISSLQP